MVGWLCPLVVLCSGDIKERQQNYGNAFWKYLIINILQLDLFVCRTASSRRLPTTGRLIGSKKAVRIDIILNHDVL